ncbi:MAG: DeoR family transcriptional regulator [Candidatus Saccharimonadales bacterium]|nr:DeoR family transcriptional regulator [Candidatus Saccharimonadales bacterium]
MPDLTERQSQILSAIVEEYAEVATPVGSKLLAKLFNVSSATIRNEMTILEKAGLIKQPHTSAGRIPTDKGYRRYVNSLGESGPKPVDRSARAIDTRIQNAGEPDLAIRSAVKTLVELTHNVGLATIGDALYVRGLSSLFAQPEFIHGQAIQDVARLIDNLEPWLRETAPNEPLNIYIGHENPIGKSSKSSLVISRFRSPFSDRSYIGVLGPTRQDYRTVTNLVSHTGKMLEKVLN